MPGNDHDLLIAVTPLGRVAMDFGASSKEPRTAPCCAPAFAVGNLVLNIGDEAPDGRDTLFVRLSH